VLQQIGTPLKQLTKNSGAPSSSSSCCLSVIICLIALAIRGFASPFRSLRPFFLCVPDGPLCSPSLRRDSGGGGQG
jgi:hypothetical protein